MEKKYKIRNLLFAVALVFSFTVKSQMVNTYSFSQSGSSYTPLSGDIGIAMGQQDDQVYGNIPIGFPFTFAGTSYTAIGLNINGWISLGPGTPISSYNPISTGSTNNIISGFARDLVLGSAFTATVTTGSNVINMLNTAYINVGDTLTGTGIPLNASVTAVGAGSITISSNAIANGTNVRTNGRVSYLLSGSSPNQVFTVQWYRAARYNATSTGFNDYFNFQIKLYETSNNIEVRYGTITTPTTNTNASTLEVGLRGASTADYNNRSVVSTNIWSTSVAGTVGNASCAFSNTLAPVSGQSYMWSPPAPCVGTPTAGTANITSTMACVGQTVGLTLTGNTIASGITYQWQSSPNGITWTSIASATTAATTQTVGGVTYYQAIVACGTNTATSTSVSVAILGAPVYASVPFLETFDNTWQNRCDTRNVPTSAYWQSNPTTGNDAWRRQDDGTSAAWTGPGTGTVTPIGAGCADFHSYFASNGTTGGMDLYANMGTTFTYSLSFYYENLTGVDSLEVFLSTNGGSTFSKLSNGLVTSPSWTKYTYNLGAVSSNSCVVRFKATSDFGNDDIGIDSVRLFMACTPPTLTLTASSSSICAGSPSTLTASGAASYTWSTGATTASIVVTPTTTVTYTVTGATGPGCPGVGTVSLTVYPRPTVTVVSSASVLCTGSTATLSGSGATTYTWNTGAFTPNITVSPTVTTTYSVVGMNSFGCRRLAVFTQSVSACTGIENILSVSSGVSVYPNPNTGLITVVVTDITPGNTIEIYDALGKLIITKSLSGNQTPVNTSELANGVYTYSIRNTSGVLGRGKLIKE